jgi:hypothetical protein
MDGVPVTRISDAVEVAPSRKGRCSGGVVDSLFVGSPPYCEVRMPRRALTFAVAVLLMALLALAAGCDGGGADGEATPGLSPTATPVPDIRQQDLTAQPGVERFLASFGGEVDTSRIIYGDLTGDGAEEALVPVWSGGEGGDIAVFIFGYGPAGLEELLQYMPKDGSLTGDIVDGVLTIAEPTFAPGDPECCPSLIRTTTYRWDGSNLVFSDVETVPAAED